MISNQPGTQFWGAGGPCLRTIYFALGSLFPGKAVGFKLNRRKKFLPISRLYNTPHLPKNAWYMLGKCLPRKQLLKVFRQSEKRLLKHFQAPYCAYLRPN